MNPIIEIMDLNKSFCLHQQGGKQIPGCEKVQLRVLRGEFAGITGKSGAGKSTILKCLYRTYLPNSGEIRFQSDAFGRIDLARATEQQVIFLRQHEIGYVSQFLKVLPRVTAMEVVQEALMESGVAPAASERQAREMLAYFRLPEPLWDAYPHTFSGGEKLRLNLARSMVKCPKVLLLDEPTASLDEASKAPVKEMILRLKREGVSMVGIFHDLEFMESVVDTQYFMQHGTLQAMESGERALRGGDHPRH